MLRSLALSRPFPDNRYHLTDRLGLLKLEARCARARPCFDKISHTGHTGPGNVIRPVLGLLIPCSSASDHKETRGRTNVTYQSQTKTRCPSSALVILGDQSRRQVLLLQASVLSVTWLVDTLPYMQGDADQTPCAETHGTNR